MEEKKQKNITVELEIEVDPKQIKDGKLKVNVTVPIYLKQQPTA